MGENEDDAEQVRLLEEELKKLELKLKLPTDLNKLKKQSQS